MSRTRFPRTPFRIVLFLWLCAVAATASAQLPTPETFFGFRMGADGQLASAETIEQYFELAAAKSDRVRIVDLGPTTDGHRTIAAIVSAPENIKNLDRIRAANQRLADPRTLPPEEAAHLAASHKVVLAIGCSIHASEIGATQAANELLHRNPDIYAMVVNFERGDDAGVDSGETGCREDQRDQGRDKGWQRVEACVDTVHDHHSLQFR